jgi:CpeT/CpcT family (DUF1001)
MTRILCFSFFICTLFFNATAQTAQNLERDFKELNQWLPGEYNNFQQVYQEKNDAVADDARHQHLHSIFFPVQINAIKGSTYFVKQYLDGDEKKVYRQQIYCFQINAAEKATQLDVYNFANKEAEVKYASVYKNPALLAELAQQKFVPAIGCEIYWKRYDIGFVGYMKNKMCSIKSTRGGVQTFANDSLLLTQNQLNIRSQIKDENGTSLSGTKGKTPQSLKRATTYTATISISYPDEKAKPVIIKEAKLHNQGGRYAIVLPDGTKTPYSLELAQVSGALRLSLYKEGEPRAMNYNATKADATQIGLNLKWLQANCTSLTK